MDKSMSDEIALCPALDNKLFLAPLEDKLTESLGIRTTEFDATD